MRTVTTITLIAVLLTSIIPMLHADARHSDAPKGPDPDATYSLDGTGASLPFQLIDLWLMKIKEMHDNFNMNPESIGSDMKNYKGVIPFAGTGTPLDKNELESIDPILHIPEILDTVNMGWNYPVAHADTGRELRIDGAGASFAFPMMDLWRVKYGELYPNVKFNYQSIGSGGGVKQHIERTVTFSASDAPLTGSEYEKAPGSVTIPAMIGAISIAYNVPSVPESGLNLTAEALCGIFLGTITKWNDPAIADANPDLELPSKSIAVAHRSDGSGTTFAFTEYLSLVCPEWDERVGYGKSVPWPTGVGAAGNEGVAGIVKTTPNSIGYVTLAYAFQTDMTTAAIQNGDNTNFVLPSIQSASDASEGAARTLPKATESWHGVNLLAAPGENSYPITSFSYMILHSDLKGSAKDLEHAKAAIDLNAWMITDGQKYSPDLLYVPISTPVTNIGLEGLSTITYDGEPLYTGPISIGEATVEPFPPQQEKKIPSWLKQVFKFYVDDQITDDELINALQFLIQEEIIKV